MLTSSFYIHKVTAFGQLTLVGPRNHYKWVGRSPWAGAMSGLSNALGISALVYAAKRFIQLSTTACWKRNRSVPNNSKCDCRGLVSYCVVPREKSAHKSRADFAAFHRNSLTTCYKYNRLLLNACFPGGIKASSSLSIFILNLFPKRNFRDKPDAFPVTQPTGGKLKSAERNTRWPCLCVCAPFHELLEAWLKCRVVIYCGLCRTAYFLGNCRKVASRQSSAGKMNSVIKT